MAYNNNVPQGNQTIASTTDPIRNNFAFIQSAVGQEHNFDPTDPTQTYHTIASMPDFGSTPALPANTNGVYYVNSGEARFVNNSGNVSKLTGALVSANGYQWLGRVLVQWGNVAVAEAGSGTVNFPAAFTTLYTLQLTVNRVGAPGSSVTANFTAASATQFSYRISNDTCNLMYWFAIGTSAIS